MFGLDDCAARRRREQLLFAALTRLVRQTECTLPTEPKRIQPVSGVVDRISSLGRKTVERENTRARDSLYTVANDILIGLSVKSAVV